MVDIAVLEIARRFEAGLDLEGGDPVTVAVDRRGDLPERHIARRRALGGKPALFDIDLVGADFAGEVGVWLDASLERTRMLGPLAGCVAVLRAVLDADDRAERVACLLSDVVLARALNWKQVLPVTAQCLTKAVLRDLTAEGQGADLAVEVRILESVEESIRLARDVARCAAALRTVAPKLRAKGSEAAVDVFLSEDAVAPASMLSPRIRGTNIPMTDRAARRFCDRLVELGVARELTGRQTFRLYGIAS